MLGHRVFADDHNTRVLSRKLGLSIGLQDTACACRWRNLCKEVYDKTVNEIDPWYCFMDTGRDNAGCDQPDDYMESAEPSVEVI